MYPEANSDDGEDGIGDFERDEAEENNGMTYKPMN